MSKTITEAWAEILAMVDKGVYISLSIEIDRHPNSTPVVECHVWHGGKMEWTPIRATLADVVNDFRIQHANPNGIQTVSELGSLPEVKP
jgi:hypothetical protein